MAAFEEDLAQHLTTRLTTLGIAGLTYGTNVRVGALEPASGNQAITRAVPHQCIFVMETRGRRRQLYADGGAGSTRPGLKFFGFQLVIRSPVNDRPAGKAWADAVVTALDGWPASGYAESRIEGSGPAYLEKDGTDHHVWTVNGECTKRVT